MPLVAPSAVIELTFDPIATVGDLNVRLETLGVALAIFVGLVVAALVGRRTPVDTTRPPDAPGGEPGDSNHLRADDLLYIAVAAVPGAVIGARIGYALVHLDFYRSNLAPLLDIGQGGLQLSLGVVGGILTASIVARLLGAPLGRWMHALAIPLLLALALGKGAMILGGTGQGQLTDVAWATAYLGPGPWGSLAPQLPADPSQAYEALATVAVMLVVIGLVASGVFRGRNGGAFLLGLGLWAIARALVAFTWRDPQVIGPLNMDQVISIVIAAVSLVLMALIGGVSTARGRRAAANPGAGTPGRRPPAPTASRRGPIRRPAPGSERAAAEHPSERRPQHLGQLLVREHHGVGLHGAPTPVRHDRRDPALVQPESPQPGDRQRLRPVRECIHEGRACSNGGRRLREPRQQPAQRRVALQRRAMRVPAPRGPQRWPR